jgi:ComF family protein
MVLTATWSRIGRAALDLVFPPRCAVCGRGGSFLCDACREALPLALPPRCPTCWQRLRGSAPCQDCGGHRPAFTGVRAACAFDGPARDLVHALKYKHFRALAQPMALLMARCLREHSVPADVLVPVPLHPVRRRVRGYDQSVLLARELGKAAGLPVAERAIVRRRATPPLARGLGASERRQSVEGAFAVRGDQPEAGSRRVLLIDDVTTTGATLDACARALLAGGVTSVWALTFARED